MDPYSTASPAAKSSLGKLLNWKLLLAIAICIIAVVMGLQITKNVGFRLVKTDPSTNGVATVAPSITLYFSDSLKAGSASVQATPNIIKSYGIQGKTIQVNLNYPMTEKKKYTITYTVTSEGGSKLTNKTISFEPSEAAYNSLTAAQRQQLMQDQDKYPASESDPLLSHLPYNGLDFMLTGNSAKDPQGKYEVYLTAQLLMSQADMDGKGNASPQAVTQHKQEVLDYITSLGLNPASYNINYQVTAPGGENPN